MIKEDNNLDIINFLQDFGCATLEELQILFNRPNDNFKNILANNLITKKDNIFVHNTKTIDKKMLAALSVICEYKKNKRLRTYHKNFFPVTLSFITNENLLYNIIVVDKKEEVSILKLLNNNSPSIPYCDKYILIFEDLEMYRKIDTEFPYLYCTYPPLKAILDV